MEWKDVVYVRDISAFLDYLMRVRGMNPAETLVRIGIDGGKGSLKIMVSLTDGSDEDGDKEVEEVEAGKMKPAFGKKLLSGSKASCQMK